MKRSSLLVALVLALSASLPVAVGALGYLVRIGNGTISAKEAICFVVVSGGLGVVSLAYVGASFVFPASNSEGEVLVPESGGCGAAVLATPLVAFAGVFGAAALGQLVQGHAAGLGALIPAGVGFVVGGMLLDARYEVRRLPDGVLLVSAGRVWPRRRRIEVDRVERVGVERRMYRGREVFVVTLRLREGGDVGLGRWGTAAEAGRIAARFSG